MEYKKPFVYIDTNFSPADGIFLKMALESFDFELVGLSANRSYMSSEAAGENILGLVNKNGLYLPVAKNHEDIESSLDREIYRADDDYLAKEDSKDLLYDIASDCGELLIITSGDLYALAKALEKYDDLKDFIGHVFLVLPDPKSTSKENLGHLDYILSLGLDLFMIDSHFADGLILDEPDLLNIFKENKDLGPVLDFYKNSDDKSLLAPLLLYMVECPQAFVFDEVAYKVNFEEKSYERVSNRKKSYLANKVNTESFFDYIRGKLC